MTFHEMSLLALQGPTSSVSTKITIGHVQLRDLIICPHVKGVVNYLHEKAIYEHDLFQPGSKRVRVLASLPFDPNTLAALPIPDSPNTLMAAGGQDADLHLSLHSPTSSSSSHRRVSRSHWQYNAQLRGSINNSVMLTSLSLTKSRTSSVEPRMAVSNNDCTVKFFDVNIRGSDSSRIKEIGSLKIDVPVNHSSVSPDGSTLLCVGDSPYVHLHRLSGSSRLTFDRIATYSLVPYTPAALPQHSLFLHYASSTLPASFSTAFSPDGIKFAVASQEGVAVVWDVRSSKPLKVFQTDKNRGRERRPTGEASGFLYEEDQWDWSRGGSKAPGWGIRSIKFSPAGCVGREIMTFTEHTSLLHVIDARTFETEEIIRVPNPSAASSSTGHRPTRSESSIMSGDDVIRSQDTDSPSESTTEEEDSVVLIPRLGSSMEEEAVRRLLGRHGIRATRPGRHSSGATPHPEDEDMEMTDVEDRERRDDLEADRDGLGVERLSSDPSSRATSSHVPMPAIHSVEQSSGPPVASRRSTQFTVDDVRRLMNRPTLSSMSRGTRPYRYLMADTVTPWDEQKENSSTSEDPLDLAGTCFDPTGSYIYVGSVKGVVEYRVRGADKRWWNEPKWA